MAAADTQAPPAEPAPAIPDYMTDPNAVLRDDYAKWRYGRAPDYSKTRAVYNETKKYHHEAGSLPQLAENLVKNWEIEASFKPDLKDWRTIDPASYSFAINGGPPQGAEHMLKVGTYNAIITPNEYYSPENSDFASSHKTFKRMMPTFAWEVVEVYSGPPQVAFRWRHWGTMKNDYVGFNEYYSKGEKVTAKAHGGPIDVEGVTVAVLDDKFRVKKLETWFDPLEMFRQIAPNGVVNKHTVDHRTLPGREHASEDPLADAIPKEHAGHAKDALQRLNLEGKTLAQAAGACPFLSSQLLPSQQASAGASTASAGGVFSQQPGSGVQATDAGKTTLGQHSSSTYASPVMGDPAARAVTGQSAGYVDEQRQAGTYDQVDKHLEQSAAAVHPHPKDVEQAVRPQPGEAVVAPAGSAETQQTQAEMTTVQPGEKDLIHNRE